MTDIRSKIGAIEAAQDLLRIAMAGIDSLAVPLGEPKPLEDGIRGWQWEASFVIKPDEPPMLRVARRFTDEYGGHQDDALLPIPVAIALRDALCRYFPKETPDHG